MLLKIIPQSEVTSVGVLADSGVGIRLVVPAIPVAVADRPIAIPMPMPMGRLHLFNILL